MDTQPIPGFALVIGLDRADQKVDLCQLGGSQAASGCSTVSTSPEALLNWFETLRKDHPLGRIGLCLEAPAGNLLAFFATHAPWLELYPVNPLTLKRFRETFVLSRANDDGKDALYLARLLLAHSDQLRRWRPEDPATARLQQLVAHRRAVVDERTALTNRLQALLKSYFPQALTLCGDDLWRPLALAFLRRWPRLQSLRKVRPETLRSFYYLHGSRSAKLIEQRLAFIEKSVALTEEPAVVECLSLRVGLVVRQLAALLPVIAQYDREIAQSFAQHPDAPIFASLPGAGPVLAPRLLAALGHQRERYPTAAALHAPPQWRQSLAKAAANATSVDVAMERSSCARASMSTHERASDIAHGPKPITNNSVPKVARTTWPAAHSPSNGNASSGAAGPIERPIASKPTSLPCNAPAAPSPQN